MEVIGEDRANIIKNAILGDGFAVGSEPWCEEHHVERWEFDAFLDSAVRMAAAPNDWREVNREVGSVDVTLTFTKHSGKVGSSDETWTVLAPVMDTNNILRVAETGRLIANLMPEQMPLPLGEDYSTLNTMTGELV